MNSYTKISNKYFRKNKRRSIVNIIAIIVATMFISGTGHMIYSSQQNIINMIREDGDYHVKFKLLQKEKFQALKVHSAVEQATFRQKVGVAELGGKTLVVNELDKDGFSTVGVNLKEGRLPKEANEIILSLDFKGVEGKKIGDKITANLNGSRKIDYTIVGFSQSINEPFSKIFDVYTVSNTIVDNEVDVYIKLKEVGNLNTKINSLAKDFSIDSNKVVKNEPLLTAMGEGKSKSALMDYAIFFMVAIIVIIATLVFIYNSFNIATMERMKEYGLIKAIGGTNKQIKNIVLKEAFIIGAIALPIGLLLGMASGTVLFRAFNSLILSKTITVKTYISLYSILGTTVMIAITIYLSALSILKKVKKISPLDCFTNRSCEVKKLNTKKRKLFSKFFSIEVIIANRNIRTNKGRFRTTVVSIALSITLFITFSSLVCNIEQLPYETTKYDMMIGRHNHYIINKYNGNSTKETISSKDKQIKLLIEKAKKIDGVKNVYSIYQGINSYTFMHEKKVVVKGDPISIKGNKYTTVKSEIVPIDLSTINQLSPYLLNKFSNKEKMKKEKGVYITQINFQQDMESSENGKYIKKNIAKLKVGDEILIDTSNLTYTNKFKKNGNTAKGTMKVKVLGIVRGVLFDKESPREMTPIIYMPTKLYNDLIEKKCANIPKDNEDIISKKLELSRLQPAMVKGFSVIYKDNISSKQRVDIGTEIWSKWGMFYDEGKYDCNGCFDEQYGKYIKFGKLFYFSVIAFITIISMANVFNIVNTNVILRSKDLALLSVVGASKKSVRKIIYLEGMLFSIIGIFYGTVLGGINSVLISKLFRRGHDIAYVYPMKETLISIVFFVVVGIVAIYFPLRKIKKENQLQYKEY